MIDELAPFTADKPAKKPRGKPLAKGYDPRRWLNGRPRVPKDVAEAKKIVDHVIWDVLSESIRNPNTGEDVDRLRMMIRSMTTNKAMQDKILDRILGKVAQSVDVTSAGEKLEVKVIEIVKTYKDESV